MTLAKRHSDWSAASHLADTQELHAVLDAVDCPTIPQRADMLGPDQAVSLWKGTTSERYWALAPYLFRCTSDILRWINQDFAGEPWGIFISVGAGSAPDLSAVSRHLRKFLVVQSPEELLYFRFYDPRILPHYLDTAPAEEQAEFFGPLSAFAVATKHDISKMDALEWFALESTPFPAFFFSPGTYAGKI